MPPMNVGILLFNDVEVLDFAGAFEVFDAANRIKAEETSGEDHFRVFTVAETEDNILTSGGLEVKPRFSFSTVPHIDILIVPGGKGAREYEINNSNLLEWIKKSQKETQITASVCTGALLLAKCGLLEGKTVTTHWRSIEKLRGLSQATEVLSDVRFVDQGSIISSAGVSAGIDMTLHIVSKLLGGRIAKETARLMEYYGTERVKGWQEVALGKRRKTL